jgi:hypothetical protein
LALKTATSFHRGSIIFVIERCTLQHNAEIAGILQSKVLLEVLGGNFCVAMIESSVVLSIEDASRGM